MGLQRVRYSWAASTSLCRSSSPNRIYLLTPLGFSSEHLLLPNLAAVPDYTELPTRTLFPCGQGFWRSLLNAVYAASLSVWCKIRASQMLVKWMNEWNKQTDGTESTMSTPEDKFRWSQRKRGIRQSPSSCYSCELVACYLPWCLENPEINMRLSIFSMESVCGMIIDPGAPLGHATQQSMQDCASWLVPAAMGAHFLLWSCWLGCLSLKGC